MTRDLVHIWFLHYLGKLCNPGGKPALFSGITQSSLAVNTTFQKCEEQSDNLSQRNCIEYPGTGLQLRKCANPANNFLSARKLYRAWEAGRATQPRNCAKAFLCLLSDACAGKLLSSLQNCTIFPCMHGSLSRERKKKKESLKNRDLFLALGVTCKVDFRNFSPSVAFSYICAMRVINPKTSKSI